MLFWLGIQWPLAVNPPSATHCLQRRDANAGEGWAVRGSGAAMSGRNSAATAANTRRTMLTIDGGCAKRKTGSDLSIMHST